jgi:hypothetical protein
VEIFLSFQGGERRRRRKKNISSMVRGRKKRGKKGREEVFIVLKGPAQRPSDKQDNVAEQF